jgi:hypothetical protein
MASQFPKLPGYVQTHDPTIVTHKKVSHIKLDQNRNAMNTEVPLYKVPQPPSNPAPPQKADASKSYSHNQFPNHFGATDIQEQFEPNFVKLDKQVLRFFGYFKESVVESRLENYRIRKLTICYYLEDKSLMITEPKQTNSGLPQGAFLKRQMVLKQDGSGRPFMPQDFCIGTDIGIYGRQIRLTGVDDYTRSFFRSELGTELPPNQEVTHDNFAKSQVKVAPQRDGEMKQFLEKSLGGGKIAS